MWKHASSIASASVALAKRGAENAPQNRNLSPMGMFSAMIVTLIFLPIIIAVSYTVGAVYPTLAIIEDPSPPAYEPVSLTDDVESTANPNKFNNSNPNGQPQMLTSSIRSMTRLLRSLGGWRACFRGMLCAFSIMLANMFMEGLLSAVPWVPSIVGSLIADLALVQLHTAWVHIVISQPSALPFYRRLPAFKKTFEATSLPIFIAWVATISMIGIPALVAYALSLPFWNPAKPNEIPVYQVEHIWIGLLALLLILAFLVFAVIPAHVVLVRVQASLLPPEEDAIVPFDRSFGGSVDPAIVGGPGYVSWKDAWKTVSRASWVRLYKLFAKVWAVNFFVHFVLFLVLMVIIGVASG